MTGSGEGVAVPVAVDGDTRRLSTEGADLLMLAGVADARAAHPRGVLRGSPDDAHFSAALG